MIIPDRGTSVVFGGSGRTVKVEGVDSASLTVNGSAPVLPFCG